MPRKKAAEVAAEDTKPVAKKRKAADTQAAEMKENARVIERLQNQMTNEEREKRIEAQQAALSNYSALSTAMREKRIVSGTIFGVTELKNNYNAGNDPTKKSVVVAQILTESGIIVSVPFEEMFIKNPLDMSTVNLASEEGINKFKRRQEAFLRKMFGLNIPFIITYAKLDDSTPSAMPTVIGSRAKAQEIIQRIAYAPNGNKEPVMRAGQFYDATITSVSKHSVALFLGGIDFTLPVYKMTMAYAHTASELYRVGDKVSVYLSDVKIDSEGKPSIVVSPIAAEMRVCAERAKSVLQVGMNIVATVSRIQRMRDSDAVRIIAYQKDLKLPVLVLGIDASHVGRKLCVGDDICIRIAGFNDKGLPAGQCVSIHGNSSIFDYI